MKDEELATKYAEEYQTKKHHKRLYGQKPVVMKELNTTFKDGFLTGLNVGRQEMHDLRKDPNDFPTDENEKLCFYEKGKVVAKYDSKYGCWVTSFNNLETIISSSVIFAWKEI